MERGARRPFRTSSIRAVVLVTLVVFSSVTAGATNLDAATIETTSSTLDDGVASSDWPTAGHDAARSGTTQNSSGPKGEPDARWIYEFANDDTDIPTVVDDGRVFVAGDQSLRAVDNETGDQLWNVTGLDTYDEISVADGIVLTTEAGYSGEIHAYDASDGTEIWNETSFSADASVVLDGTLYVAKGEYLHAFDLQTGTEQWNVRTDEDISLALSASGDTIYATGQVNNRDYAVYALNASDASERWRFEMEGPVSMHPVVSNGSVYVGAGSEPRDSTNGAYDPKFYRLNDTDGHVEWIFDVNTRPHGAAVANGSVYLASGNTIRRLGEETGEQQWIHRLPGSITYGVHYYRVDARPPVVADGVVYAVNDRGHMVALDSANGDELWGYRLEGYAMSPAVADDRVYVHTTDTENSDDYTRVYALEEPPFQFSGFAPSKTTVEPGEQFTVDVTIENVDDETRDYNLSLRADLPYPRGDPVLGWKNGTLGPGDQKILTFTTKLHSAASWNLSVQRLLETEPSIGPVTVDVVHPNPDDRWSMDGFDANRSDANPNTDGPSQYFQQAWNVSNVDEGTTPLVDNGTVYAIRLQNRYNGLADIHTVSALDLETGIQHWEYNFTADNRIPTGSPAVVNDTVYVVTKPYQFNSSGPSTEHGSVYAFDANTGNRAWKTTVSINKSSNYDHGPVVANGLVYTAGAIYEQNDYYVNASVVALDAVTGGLVWSNGMADRSEQESYGTYALGDQHLFVTASNQVDASNEYEDDLHAYDATSSSLDWTTSSLNLVVDQRETPVVADGLVFVVNESKNADGDPAEELVALNVSNGAEEWRFSPPDVPNYYGGDSWRLVTPTVSNGSLFVRQRAYSDGSYSRLHRIDVATGNATWNRSTNYLWHVQVVDGIVYGAETGYIRLYDAETGEKHGDSYGRISVAVANGTVLTYEPEDDRMEAVVEGGIIEYTDLSVDTHTIDEYENVTVTATATNVGDLPRKYTVNLDVAPDDHSDRYFWDSKERRGTLAPGESTTLSWNVRLDTRGDFVFFLQPSVPNSELDRYALDNAGSATVHVGDVDDGQVFDLGGPRTLEPDTNSWPKESYDSGNTGNASGNSGPTAVSSNPVNWSVNHSSEWTSGPTLANETVFVGGYGGGDDSVFAYNATDGSLRWQYATSNDIEIPPVYAGGYLYTVASYGKVYQLNATTGERLWTFDAGDDGGIAVVDNVAYITGETSSGSTLFALNATTREVLWTFSKSSTGYGTAPAYENGTVYVTLDGQGTYAVNASTGVEEWGRSIAGSSSRVHSPVVGDGIVYVDDTTYSSTNAHVYALDAADGSTIWSEQANVDGYAGSSPALANDTLFFLADGAIQALDATTGTQQWSNQICAAAERSPVYADGVVFVPMTDSTIRAYDATSGDLVWRYEAYYGESFTPAVVDGMLYSTGLEYDVNNDPYPLIALEGGTSDQPETLFDYSGLSVSATNVSEGEQLTVSATVENLASSSCSYTADFSVDGSVVDSTSGTLSSGYSDSVDFTWTFSTQGTHNVTIADLPPVDVNVTASEPDVDVSPSTRDFGDVTLGNYADRYVSVSNVGTETLSIVDTAITGTDAAEFTIQSVSQTTIYPDKTATIWFRYEPDSSGSSTATFEVDTNDPDEATATATLTGTGVGPAEVDVSPTSVDFGDVEVGSNATTNVTVSNVGGSDLSFDGAQLTGTDAAVYQIIAWSGTTTIAAGGTHNVTIEFEPTATGPADATLELSTDDADESTVSVALSGNGTITTPNRAPVAAADHYVTIEDTNLSVSAPGKLINDLDPNGDSIIASHHGNPTNGTLHDSTTAGNFEYEPDPGFTGTDSFTYRIRDDEGAYSSFVPVTIEVLPDPNRAPDAIDDQYSVHAGKWLNVSASGVLANDRDPDGDTIDTKYHGNPSHGTLESFYRNGGFNYSADRWHTGTDSFNYWIEDEHDSESGYGTVTIEVLPPKNREPTAVADSYSVRSGEWLNVSASGVLANDYDLDGDHFGATQYGNPEDGTLESFGGSGGFNYTAEPGFVGTDSFVYRVQDEHGEYSSNGAVTIEVLPDPNRAPMAVPDDYVVLQGQSLVVDAPGLLANDYDPDNDTFTASHHGNPSHGTLVTSTTAGNFEYIPDAGFTGVDSFTYRIKDEHGEYSGYAPVTITVVEATTSGLADVAVAQDSVDFGYVPAGTSVTETVTVANVGDKNLTFSGAMLSGANASAFDVISGNATTILGYGGTTTFTVEYAPTTLGVSDATLTVHSDDPDESTVNVTLDGEAYDDDAPTIHTIEISGSYVNNSDPVNGSVVYENETVGFEVNVTDAFGSVRDVTVTLDAQSSSDQTAVPATENTTTGNWTATIDVSTLSDGEYDVTVDADDTRGNDASVTSNDTVVVDTEDPSLSVSVTRLNATDANMTVRAPEELRFGTLSVEVEDPDGTVTDVTMIDEGDRWNGTFSPPKDGQYNLTASATDLAGNSGSDDATTRFANESTVNNTITVQMQPSGLFVRFTTNRSVNNTFVTMTESKVPVEPLVRGQAPVNFLDTVIGQKLTQNLSYAVIGIPVDTSLLQSGTDVDDVTIRYFNETRRQWTAVPTTVENVTVNGTTDQYWVATVTHFSTYGAVASDTTPPTVTSSDPSDGHELPAGTTSKTIRVEYDDANSGVNTDEVTVVYDGTIVNGKSATTITSDYVEYDATGLTDGSSHDLEVTVEDDAGNAHTETVSFTVASASGGSQPPSSGDTGTSTGDASTSPAPSVTVESLAAGGIEAMIDDGRAGTSTTVVIPDGALVQGGVSLDRLVVTPAVDRELAFHISIEQRPETPFDAASGTVLAYLNVSHPSVPNADIDGATVRFSVDRAALEAADATPGDVALHRHHAGAWTALETTVVAETDTSVVYEAASPGLSVFAIAAATQSPTTTQTTASTTSQSTATATPAPPTTAAQASTTTASADEPGNSLAGVLVVALLLLAALGVATRLRRRD